ncbi:MAG: hypothetical protein R2736_09755 [Solirubrobacterales bacterium]
MNGTRDGVDTQLIYDLVVRSVGASASAWLTRVCAAIGTDLIAEGGPVGVVPAEGAFDPPVFLRALAERGFAVQETRIAREMVL